MSEIPKIEYIDAIQADNAGSSADVLCYEGLYKTVKGYAADNGRRIDSFWEAEPESIEELISARQLGFEYFVATADRVISSGPHNRDLWADRYTNASIELFGAPDPEVATRLVARQVSELQTLQGSEHVSQNKLQFVLEQYAPIITGMPESIDDETDKKDEANQRLAIKEIGRILEDRYGSVLDLATESGTTEFNQEELVELFSKALDQLAAIDDEAWKEWKVVSPKKGSAISVNGKEQGVKIPRSRDPVSANEARRLLAHELLVHGLRAKNGRKSGDDRLLKGYPNYLAGEEGLAIIAGAAASGHVGEVTYDRYIDITLAAGIIGEAPKKRGELYELVYARKLIRAQSKNELIDEDELQEETSKYVDRIYRGSPGDNVGNRQAVYTADIYYYEGFRTVSNYIAQKLEEGHSMESVFDYLMQGKFNPTDPLHTNRIGLPK